MKLNEIFEPIRKDLLLVKIELEKIFDDLEESPARVVFEHYFKTPGKLLRPSLLLLSAAAADLDEYHAVKQSLLKAAAAIELVHNASLIHDDVVDHEMLRRGQTTINNAYGNKVAIMAGNALFSRAVTILLRDVSKETAFQVIQMVRKMSTAEIHQLNRKDNIGSRKEYMELIEGKTALLMSSSCVLGAGIVKTNRENLSALRQFGLNFGMAYQIVDDIIDQDPLAIRNVTLDDAKEYTRLAASSIESFDESACKSALIEMLDYILSLTHIHAETNVKSEKNMLPEGSKCSGSEW